MKLANVDETVLLLVLDQIEFEAMGLLLDVIVRLLQLRIQLLILICAVFLLLEDLSVVFVLVRHLLRLLLQLQKLCIFFFDVALGFGHVLLELSVQVDEHILPVK